MTPNASETLRSLAEALPDVRRWAAENGFAGALDDVRHRHVVEAALDGRIPATRINGRWFFDPSRVAEIAQGLRHRMPARGHRTAPASVAA